MASDNIRWVKKDAFVLPTLPKYLKVVPVLAGFLHLAAFLELSGNNTIDLDGAVLGAGESQGSPALQLRQLLLEL
jgi:hypothetical protein